jgi:hypothetical protein
MLWISMMWISMLWISIDHLSKISWSIYILSWECCNKCHFPTHGVFRPRGRDVRLFPL